MTHEDWPKYTPLTKATSDRIDREAGYVLASARLAAAQGMADTAPGKRDAVVLAMIGFTDADLTRTKRRIEAVTGVSVADQDAMEETEWTRLRQDVAAFANRHRTDAEAVLEDLLAFCLTRPGDRISTDAIVDTINDRLRGPDIKKSPFGATSARFDDASRGGAG